MNLQQICAVLLLLCSACAPLKKVGQLSDTLRENSALLADKGRLWLLNDSGNSPDLYAVDSVGTLKAQLHLINAKNIDWEALTKDKAGNYYIGDIGNNRNRRKDLCIYKINPSAAQKDSVSASCISFYYPEQKAFPPDAKQRNFDAEALIALGDSLYLFTKNRTKPNDGYIYCYRLPQSPGEGYAAQLHGRYRLKLRKFIYSITDAALSPDEKTLVLLSMNRLHVFQDFRGSDFFNARRIRHYFLPFTQKEAICFVDAKTLYLSDEKSYFGKARLYRLRLRF